MLKFVVVALLVSYAAAGPVSSVACSSGGGSAKFISADIEGCSGNSCTITKQTDTNIVVQFEHNSQIISGTYLIIATYLGFEITITDKSVCDGLNGCTHAPGAHTHRHVMNLASNAPAVTAAARLEIRSGNTLLTCRSLPSITIKNK